MSFPATPPIAPAKQDWRFPAVRRLRLGNGLRVCLLPQRQLPMIRLRLMIPGGRRLEAFGVAPGTTALTMRCSRYGTENYAAADLALAMDALGTSIQSLSGLDALAYSMQCTSEAFAKSMELFGELLLRPVFPSSELEREAAKLAASKRQSASSPSANSGLWMSRLLYEGHPYGVPSSSPEEVLAVPARDLQEYHHRHVRPHGAVLVLVGDFETARMADFLAKKFGSWTGEAPVVEPPSPARGPKGKKMLFLERPGALQSQVLLGAKAIDRSHPDHLGMQLINHIFGGGASSRLFKDLREKRSLTYGCSSSLDSGAWGGDLVAGLSCSSVHTVEAVEALLDQFKMICTTAVEESELEACKRYKLGTWPAASARIRGMANLVMAQAIHGLPEDTWQRYPDRVDAMHRDRLFAMAQEHLSSGDIAVVVVGSAEAYSALSQSYEAIQRKAMDARPERGVGVGD